MAILAVEGRIKNDLRYSGGVGVNANDLVIQTNNVLDYDTFLLMSTSGALQVLVTLDDSNYSTAPLSLTDLGATTSDPVLLTAANRIYRFRGTFSKIQVTQNGATGVNNAVLICSNTSKY